MEDEFKGVDPMVYESRISVPYSWWAGDTAGKFYRSIRDEKKMMGTECRACGKVFIPPRKSCPQCFGADTRWVEVSDEGTLMSYTVARRQLAALPKPVPVYFGLVKLDGADTGLLHFIENVDDREIRIGMRMKIKFSHQRKGTLNDIEGFVPVE